MPPARGEAESDVEGDAARRAEEWEARVLSVLRDIAPEWAARFEERMTSDPETTRRQLFQHGRRFMGLAALRERNPDLYAMKVREIRLQAEARQAGIAYHDALERGVDDEIKQAEARLRDLSRQAVEANLKARGEELKALAEAVDRFKEELLKDAQGVGEQVDAMMRDFAAKRPSAELFPVPPSRGTSREGSVEGGSEGRGRTAPAGPPARP